VLADKGDIDATLSQRRGDAEADEPAPDNYDLAAQLGGTGRLLS
jgi:hypothetical protein